MSPPRVKLTNVNGAISAVNLSTPTLIGDTTLTQLATGVVHSTSGLLSSSLIVAADISNNAVITAKIADSNVTTAKIADSNVTTAKIADGAITSAKIADGTIVNADVANNTLKSTKFVNNSITLFNTAFGDDALNSSTTGNYNTATGVGALVNNTTGSQNVATGAYALEFNTTGFYNVATGVNALVYNTTGNYNTATGRNALFSNTTGSQNVANGVSALQNNRTGIFNVASGSGALLLNTIGSNNTALGTNAGYNNKNPQNNNTFIGSNSDLDSSASFWGGSTAIGSNSKITAHNQITLGGDVGSGFPSVRIPRLDRVGVVHNDISGNLTTSLIVNADVTNNTLTSAKFVNNSDASLNIAFGNNALARNTTGMYNTATGSGALRQNESGFSNVATGADALGVNTFGSNNVATGDQALLFNTGGSGNVATGKTALFLNTTGTNSTAIGLSALRNNTTGNNNSALGATAGSNNKNAQNSNNTFLGSFSDLDSSANLWANSTAIGANSRITASNQITLGTSAETVRVPKLNSVGVVHNNAIGDLSTSLIVNADITNNTLTNIKLIGNSDALQTTALGNSALISNIGSNNTAIGYQALTSNTTSNNNTAVGYRALTSNRGGDNTAIGFLSLEKNTTGSNNVASGFIALQNNTTGSNNTASGFLALQNNTTASNNTSFGFLALQNNTTASNNTAIGFLAGTNNKNSYSSNNTFLGANADLDSSLNAWKNSTAIGYDSKITDSNQIVLGTSTETVRIPKLNSVGVVHNAANGNLSTSLIVTADVADSAVTNGKIADSNVTTVKIADSNVTTVKIADSAVTTAKIADSAVTTAKIDDANVTTAKIADNAVTADKLASDISYNGLLKVVNCIGGVDSQVANKGYVDSKVSDLFGLTAPASLDTLSEIANAIADASGNTIFAIKTSVDESLNLKANIADPTFTGTVSLSGLNSVGVVHNDASGNLSTSLIAEADIDNSAVTTSKMADSSVTADKLASDISFNGLLKVVDCTGGVDSQVTNKGYVDSKVSALVGLTAPATLDTLSEIANAIADASGTPIFPLKTSVDESLNLKANIADPTFTGTVSLSGLNSVGVVHTDVSGNLSTSKIVTADISDNVVTNSKITSNAITSAKIADLNVTSGKIAINAVTTARIADNAVTTVKIANSNVTSAKIADSNVTSAKIANNAVTAAKLASDISYNGILKVQDCSKGVDSQVANKGYVDSKVSDLVGLTAPATLDTLSEIANAIADASGNPLFPLKTSVDESLNLKANIADPTFTGTVSLSGLNSVGVVHNDASGNLSTSLIAEADISDIAVTSAKIADNAVTAEKLANDISFNGLLKVVDCIGGVDSQVANKGYVDSKVSDLVGLTAPATLDTLSEIANAIADASGNPLFPLKTSVDESLNLKANIADPTFTGTVSLSGLNSVGVVHNDASGNLSTSLIAEADISDIAVTSAKIADNAVTAEKIADSAVTSAKIADSSVTADKLDIDISYNGLLKVVDCTGGVDSQVTNKGYVDSKVSALVGLTAPATLDTLSEIASAIADACGNSIFPLKTSVDESLNLKANIAGPTFTGSVRLSGLNSAGVVHTDVSGNLSTGLVVAADIANNAVTNSKITSNAITSAKIADLNVTSGKIAINAVTTVRIADNAVTTVKIADSNVTSDKIADSNVTTVKIADGAITSDKIASANITTDKIANANITSAKIASDIDLSGSPTTTTQASGDNSTKIATTEFVTNALAGFTGGSGEVADGSITSAKIESDVALSGSPTTSTPASGDNSTKIATTAFVSQGYVKKTGDEDISGNKTFNDSIRTSNINGISDTNNGTLNIGSNCSTINIGNSLSNINIDGSLCYVNTTNLQVEDKLITLNKGGASSSGSGSGFEIEENNAVTSYIKLNSERDAFVIKTPADSIEDTIATITALNEQTLYSNSYYANDNKVDIQTALDKSGASQGVVVFASSGSYGSPSSNLLISGRKNIGIIAPVVGNVTITELPGTRGIDINGADSTRVRLTGLQVKGMTTIDGTLGRHYFSNMNFQGGVTFTGSMTNWVTFNNCDIATSFTVNSTFAGTIYLVNCSFNGVTLSLNNASPIQVILSNCSGLGSYPSALKAYLYGINSLSSGASSIATTTATVSSLATAGVVHNNASGVLSTSLIVAADIANAAVTADKIASDVALAGSPTTTTPASGDNSTKIATTAFVSTALAGFTGGSGGVSDASLNEQTLYSNSYYANDNKVDIQAALDKSGAAQSVVVYVSAGSYGSPSSNLLISGRKNIGIIAPVVGNVTITELPNTRGIDINGADSTRVRLTGLQVKGMTTIDGTLGRHYFSNMNFQGGVTFTGSMTNWVTFNNCDIATSFTVNSTFAGTIYLVNCSFNGVTLSLNNSSPIQVILSNCSGLGSYPSDLKAYLYGINSLSSGASSIATTTATVSSLATAGIVHNNASGVLSTGLIDAADIASAAVTSDKIADSAITSAKIASDVALSGAPTAPTPATSDNSTKIATTAFVSTALAGFTGGSGGVSDASLNEQTLYSNSYYANDNKVDIQAALDKSGAAQSVVVYVSAGSYGSPSSNLLISGRKNIGIIAPLAGNVTITELPGTRGIDINGADSTHVKLTGLQVKGMTTIDGTLGRHYFSNMNFQGGVTFTGSMTNWVTFNNCDIATSFTVNSTFAGTIYLINCSFNGVTLSLNNASPIQVILSNCSGLGSYPSALKAYLGGFNSLSSGASSIATTTATVSSLATAGIVHNNSSGVLSTGLIDAADIANAAITSDKIAPNVALSGEPTAPTPATSDNSTKIATTEFVTTALAGFTGGSGGSGEVADGSITSAKIAPNVALSGEPTAPTPATSDNSTKIATTEFVTTALAGFTGGSGEVADGSITTAKLVGGERIIVNGKPTTAPGCVTTHKIATYAVTSDKISTGAVTNAKIALDAVTNENIVNGSITNAKFADNAITTDKLSGGEEIIDKMGNITRATGCVTTDKIADDAVTEVKIADGAITSAKIAPGACSSMPDLVPSLVGVGSFYFDTANKKLKIFDGSNWYDVTLTLST
jgi:hypothetical protein